MSSYLFLWNPKKDTYSFADYDRILADAAEGKPYSKNWICPSKQPCPGDIAYVQRTGPKHNGIFAKGVVTTEAHWSKDGIQVVGLRLEQFLPIGLEIPRSAITDLADYHKNWCPMSSGNIIPDLIEGAIICLWPKGR